MTAPQIKVTHIEMEEAPIGLRLPFRYGAVTLHQAVEARVTVHIVDKLGRAATGFAAEIMAPKWFDKSPDLSDGDNVAQLRNSFWLAAELYRSGDFATAFELHAQCDAVHAARCAERNLSGLVAGFGNAQLDKAILSALRPMLGLSREDAIRSNVIGINARTAPDLKGFDFDRFLNGLVPRRSLTLRHTVGGMDPLCDADINAADAPRDDLPVSLQDAIRRYGLRAFKLKLSGDIAHDIERLLQISEVLDSLPGYLCTLDGNEQFESPEDVLDAWRLLLAEPRLARLLASVAYLEQPISRDYAIKAPLGPITDLVDVIIDESDESIDTLPDALRQGYRGTSIKSCKGIYRALLNAARLSQSDARNFLTAEDLCTQPGPGVEDDLAMASILGIPHIERNGHHFGNGVSWASDTESGFHPLLSTGIYHRVGPHLSLRPERGEIDNSDLLSAASSK